MMKTVKFFFIILLCDFCGENIFKRIAKFLAAKIPPVGINSFLLSHHVFGFLSDRETTLLSFFVFRDGF